MYAPITTAFVGIFAVMQVPLTMLVGIHRGLTGIAFLDGGDDSMLRRMRAHGNFIETVPIILIAMAAAELGGLNKTMLLTGGVSLLIGRALHIWAALIGGLIWRRALGMILTLLPMLGFGLWDIGIACRVH